MAQGLVAGRHRRRHARETGADPGIQVVMAQPISDRVDEMVTGVRSDIAVKVFGDDLDQLKITAEAIARVGRGMQGAEDIRIEKISGQQYLSIDIDRQAVARYGLNVTDVNDLIETAIGGKAATEIFEGERRFPAVVRLPAEDRSSIQSISDLLVSTRAALPCALPMWPTSRCSMALHRSAGKAASAASSSA
jgi:cobalt-zinc-cadmium resistance protein CzcA